MFAPRSRGAFGPMAIGLLAAVAACTNGTEPKISNCDAANALSVHDAVIYPAHFPRTAERLERAGLRLLRVPCGEIAKAEGGVTCCSLLFSAPD